MNTEKTKSLPYQITSFYRFVSFSNPKLKKLREDLLIKGKEHKVVGLILLGREGINATVSGLSGNMKEYLKNVEQVTGIDNFFYKKSPSAIPAFKQLRIKIKKEIITFGKNVRADFGLHNLEPDEWESMLNEQEVTVLDIRNNYEVELGKFEKAVHFNIEEFKDFSEKLQTAKLPKERKTLLYCTGGIRCEKAIAEMRAQGFKELYQLKGGILHYLKSFPNKSFKGDCFVFDHRVAVNQNLSPSPEYSLCPHCGQPAKEKINCAHCNRPAQVCQSCLKKKLEYLMTCTKNCSHHFRLNHKCKSPFK